MWMIKRLVLVLLAVFLVWLMLLRCRGYHPQWEKLKTYRYAHRGYHNKPTVPENSMAAFRAAVERGWGAELDVHLMKDGSLAVIHDSSLKRTAGADVCIEDMTMEDLANYQLEERSEQIPLLQEVLALFEGKAPLIIELKPERGNHAALSRTVADLLQSYTGDYCIESFDPRVVRWFRINCPAVCRGQLAENFLRSNSRLPGYLQVVLTNLLMNFRCRPDFVAYKFEDRKGLSLRLCEWVWKPARVSWTIRSKADLLQAEREGRTVIFETFDPEQ